MRPRRRAFDTESCIATCVAFPHVTSACRRVPDSRHLLLRTTAPSPSLGSISHRRQCPDRAAVVPRCARCARLVRSFAWHAPSTPQRETLASADLVLCIATRWHHLCRILNQLLRHELALLTTENGFVLPLAVGLSSLAVTSMWSFDEFSHNVQYELALVLPHSCDVTSSQGMLWTLLRTIDAKLPNCSRRLFDELLRLSHAGGDILLHHHVLSV